MATVLALELVYEAVVARFDLEAPTVEIRFGAREVGKAINRGPTARVVFEPGVDGKAGDYVRARAPGRNPRPLATLLETATVYCWAYDPTAPRDELAQYRAARLLHDGVIRAIEKAMRTAAIANLGAAPFSDPEWVDPSIEHSSGAEIKFTLTLEAMIPDEAYEEVTIQQVGEGALLNDEVDAPSSEIVE